MNSTDATHGGIYFVHPSRGHVDNLSFLDPSIPLDLPPGGLVAMVTSLVIGIVVGILGNLLTLIALPYVRNRYGQEFSVLQTSYAVLLLHLSLCDIIYCSIGFPHFIEVYIIGHYRHGITSCWWLGMLRNLVAYADFSTIAVISICACSHRLCKTCRNLGSYANHGNHDKFFGGKRIYFVCFCIWVSSFGYMAPDIFGVTGTFGWDAGNHGSLYGCNRVTHSQHFNFETIHFHLGVGIPLVIIVVCYSLLGCQLWKDKRITAEIIPGIQDKMNQLTRKYLLTFFALAVVYVVFIVPAYFTDFAGKPLVEDPVTKAVFTSLYFWVYGINFIIYVVTNKRLRDAYMRCLRDFHRWSLGLLGSPEEPQEETSRTSLWWGKMKDMSQIFSQRINSETYDTKV